MGEKSYSLDEEGAVMDFETIKNVDSVCVIPYAPYFAGVHVEIGCISANKKPLKIFLKKYYPYMDTYANIN